MTRKPELHINSEPHISSDRDFSNDVLRLSSRKPPVFAREATGLVREVSGRASFVADWMLVVGGYPVFILTYLGTFPGANFILAFILGFLPMFALLGVYTLFGISMPRAGGDYIYTSRALNPVIGFVSSFAIAACYMVTNGIFTTLGTYYLGYQLTTVGIVDNNPTLLSLGGAITTPTYAFAIAVVILAISLGIAIIRPRYAWSWIFWAGLVAIICNIIMFAVLATINQSSFQVIFDNFIATHSAALADNGFYNATNYEQTIVAAGWTPPSGLLAATLPAFPIALYTFAWSQFPTNWAGEIKSVKKNLPLVLLGGLLWILVYFVLLVQLGINSFGQPFLTSWSILSTDPSYPLATTLSDYIPFFAYLVYHNPIVLWIMFLALFIPVVFEVPPLLMASVRYLFAFSFDRVLPAKLSVVNERTHTPIIATVIAFAVNIYGAVAQAFYPASTPSLLVPMTVVAYLVVALAAIVFPFARRQIYDTSFVVKRKILGIPTITWLGIISFIGLAVGMYGIIASGFYPIEPPDYIFFVVAYGLGIIIYVAAYYFTKKSGLDLSLAFREIPPE
jgi:APA family basic amino acid/polyamine antiporter